MTTSPQAESHAVAGCFSDPTHIMPAGTAVILGLGVVWIWILSDLVSVTLDDPRGRKTTTTKRVACARWVSLVVCILSSSLSTQSTSYLHENESVCFFDSWPTLLAGIKNAIEMGRLWSPSFFPSRSVGATGSVPRSRMHFQLCEDSSHSKM